MYYKWSKRIPIKSEYKSYKKIAIKTSCDMWVDSSSPAIIMFSVDSFFHEGEKGLLNLKYFISTIKQKAKGPIKFLVTELTHINVQKLKYNERQLLQELFKSTYSLISKLTEFCDMSEIVLWSDFVSKDSDYNYYLSKVNNLYKNDGNFRELILQDAELSYTEERKEEFPNKEAYLNAAIKDLLEQAVYPFIASKNGYKFDFYPGKQNSSFLYISNNFISSNKIIHVHTNITYERR